MRSAEGPLLSLCVKRPPKAVGCLPRTSSGSAQASAGVQCTSRICQPCASSGELAAIQAHDSAAHTYPPADPSPLLLLRQLSRTRNSPGGNRKRRLPYQQSPSLSLEPRYIKGSTDVSDVPSASAMPGSYPGRASLQSPRGQPRLTSHLIVTHFRIGFLAPPSARGYQHFVKFVPERTLATWAARRRSCPCLELGAWNLEPESPRRLARCHPEGGIDRVLQAVAAEQSSDTAQRIRATQADRSKQTIVRTASVRLLTLVFGCPHEILT